MSQPSTWPLPPQGKRVLTPGFVRQQLAAHALSRGCYPTAMGYYPRAWGHRMRRTQHDDNLVMLCTEGRGWLTIDERRREIRSGDAILLPRGLSHEYAADNKLPWSIFWVHFSGDDGDALMRWLAPNQEHCIHPGAMPALTDHFEQLLEVGRTGYSSTAFIVAANQLRYMLTGIAQYRDQQSRLREGELDLASVQRFMRNRVTGKVSLDELAQVAGVSTPHFAERYRTLTGYPPIRHFTHMKMEAACRLLDSTEQSVKSIAGSLGYDDPLYFSRVFRKIIGSAPRDYRASRLG